jgi:hypothetical protein
MIAWVAASNDPSDYGKVSVFDFPVSSNVFGPEQMEGLIAQNPQISGQVTLWTQGGSQVILGNLLVIPLQDSLLYIEPVYLVSTNNPIPVFEKVVVGTPSQVVWGDTLQDALNQIYAGQGTTGPVASTSPGASGSPGASATPAATTAPAGSPTPAAPAAPQPSVSLTGTPQQLIAEANAHYQAAQTALRNGDWATYGKEMNIVQQLLTQLQQVLGTPAPASPVPSGS